MSFYFPLANLLVPNTLKRIASAPLPDVLTSDQIRDIRNFVDDYHSAGNPANASGLQVWDIPTYRCVYAFKNNVHLGVTAAYMRHDFSTGSACIRESDDEIPGSSAAGYGPETLLSLLRKHF